MMKQTHSVYALEVNGISKSYGRRKALRSCEFVLPHGASLVIFGANGAGKSTLLRVLATLEKPTSGIFSVFGLDTGKHADEVRERIGLISHASMLYPDLTAEENLMVYAQLYGVPDAQKRVRELLDFIELGHRRDDCVRGFSRGMTQRVAIARGLVNAPSLILLDEPYAGLDPHAARIVDALFTAELSFCSMPHERTLVSVSHSPKHGYAQATHVLLLSRGKQELFSTVDALTYEELEHRLDASFEKVHAL